MLLQQPAAQAPVTHGVTLWHAYLMDMSRIDCHISLGRSGTCQHGAFSRVGAIVASFVLTECPVGRGMWGIFGKPLKRAFRRCMGSGGSGTIFFRKFAVTVDRLGFACSSPVSDRLHRTPTPIAPTYGHMRVKSFGWICCI